MSKKAFRILAICTIVAVVAAIWAVRQDWSRWDASEYGTKVFPDLAAAMDDIASIEIAHRGETITIERSAEGWVVIESDRFPARSKAVQELLFALSEATRLEPKTQDTGKYPKLEVGDPSGPKAESKKIVVRDMNGERLADLVLGKENLLLQAIGEGGAYLRLPDAKRVWLVSGNLTASAESKDWLDNPIMNIPRQRIRRAELRHPNGDLLVVTPTDKDDGGFAVDGLGEDEALISEYYPTDIARVFEDFEIVGAKRRDAVDFPADGTIKGRYRTIDGLEIDFDLATIDGEDWLRFNSAETDNRQSDEAVKEAQTIGARTKGWAFRIPQYESTHLKKTRKQVVEKAKPQS